MSDPRDDGWVGSMAGPTIGAPAGEPVVTGFPEQFLAVPYAGPPAAAVTAATGAGGSGAPSHGLNVPLCRDISYGLTKDAEGLDRIGREADATVRRILLAWDGADADRFRARWGRSQRHLEEALTSLRTVRQRLDLAVDEQEAASRS